MDVQIKIMWFTNGVCFVPRILQCPKFKVIFIQHKYTHSYPVVYVMVFDDPAATPHYIRQVLGSFDATPHYIREILGYFAATPHYIRDIIGSFATLLSTLVRSRLTSRMLWLLLCQNTHRRRL